MICHHLSPEPRPRKLNKLQFSNHLIKQEIPMVDINPKTQSRLIGLLALRSEIDREIEDALDEAFKVDSGRCLKSIMRDTAEYLSKFLGEQSPAHSTSTENAGELPEISSTGMSAEDSQIAAPIAASVDPRSIPQQSRPDAASFPIAILKLAKGWEEKLAAAGVATVGDLGNFIYEKKLVPGFAPRIGPDAIEKIKAAWRAFVYPGGADAMAMSGAESTPPTGLSSSPTASPASTPAPAATPLAAPQKSPEEITAEGAEFARLGYLVTENPHPKGTPNWHLWDRGWQEYFATHEADDEATREDGGSEITAGFQVSSESDPDLNFPEMDLAGVSPGGSRGVPAATSPAPAAVATAALLDTSDL